MPDLHETINNFLEGSIATIGRAPVIESKSITENGTYTAPSGVDGYSPITVNVPTPTPVIESKSITENGTYTAPSGVDGYSPITVNVPTPTMDDITITQNGTYLPASHNLDGFDQVVVNVPTTTPVIESKSITENGTYTAPEGVDGYSPITVNVPSIAKKIFNKNMASFNEASMAFEFELDSFNVIWTGSSSIGAQVYGLVNLRGYNKITVRGHAGTSYYWTYSQQDAFKLTLGLSSVMATMPSQVTPIDYIRSAPLNEDFIMEITIPANTDCYMYFAGSGFNLNNVQIEVS